MITTRRVVAISATAVLGVAVLAACSSSAGSSSSSSAASAGTTTGMLPPIIINVDETTVTAKVGDFIDILVADNDLAGTTVDTDQPELVELTQAHEDGSAMFNPGGKALAPGVAVITVTNPDNTSRDITLTITE